MSRSAGQQKPKKKDYFAVERPTGPWKKKVGTKKEKRETGKPWRLVKVRVSESCKPQMEQFIGNEKNKRSVCAELH